MEGQLRYAAASRTDQKRARRSSFAARILGVYLLSRLILVPAILGSHRSFAGFVELWDGRHYLRIAAQGYPTSLAHHGTSVVAFLPLFPLLVRFAAPAFGNSWVLAGMVVSFLTGATACLAVGALACGRFGDKAGIRAGGLFALAPGAAFLSWGYAEGLAISLCAVALIMLDRRRWLAAGLIGALATAASSLAAPIVLAALWAALRAGERRAWLSPVLAASGFASYCLYLWVHLGTPFGWFDAERIGWHVHIDPWSPVHWLTTHPGVAVVETLCLGIAVGGMWAMLRVRVPGTWWAYTLPLLASVTFNAGSWLSPRFLLSAFPLAAAVAIVVRGPRFRTLLLSSGFAMVLVLIAYTTWTFVYQP